jgi:hypothetical protein
MHAQAVAPARERLSMHNDKNGRITVGKYLISPMTRLLENGWYACSVSIRSGRGQATTDRVLRLTRLFRDSVSASDYAVGEGLQWMGIQRPALTAA